ncbi:hypothetical protein HPB48_009065 [Haemaphysalis longicornis]|uniref:Endonuclease/exonuclease/phosphatase domain-containing protein n=1 Tax=Haemaphysalis longicornis TaxID=44386 RepID=A0A9J6FXI0_HAELO|nr:hypothetical protein HPB48_009065 [Haemaphysalis longicornis]
MGDFNGHIQAIDGFQDYNGNLMVGLTEKLSLEIANLRGDCEGDFTWRARNSRSCIDYALISSSLAAHIRQVHIDEAASSAWGVTTIASSWSLSSPHQKTCATASKTCKALSAGTCIQNSCQRIRVQPHPRREGNVLGVCR